MAATTHFLVSLRRATSVTHRILMVFLKGHHISSVVHLYEDNMKLANLDVSLTSIWSLLVSLLRCDDLLASSADPSKFPNSSAASLTISLLWEIIYFFVPLHVKMYAKEGTGTRFASWLLGQPALALVPMKGLKGLSGAQPPAKNTGNSSSDPAQSQLTASLADNLKIGIKAMHSMANDEARRLFHRNYNYGYPEVGTALSS